MTLGVSSVKVAMKWWPHPKTALLETSRRVRHEWLLIGLGIEKDVGTW